MTIPVFILCLFLHSSLAGNCDIEQDIRCEKFIFKGTEYKKGDCKYDYAKQRSWCAIEVDNDLVPQDWRWCPESCDNDQVDCSQHSFEQKFDGLWYKRSTGEYKGDTVEPRCSSKNAILAHAESEDQLDAIKIHLDEDASHLWIGLKKKPKIDGSGYEANQVIWIKDGSNFHLSNIVPVETNEDGDECVAVQAEPVQAQGGLAGSLNAAGEVQYKIVDKDCDDRYKVLCQKQCGGEQGEVTWQHFVN